MSGTHHQYAYDPALIANDSRVSYTSTTYPWLIAVYRFPNFVNLHSEWDLIRMPVPRQPGKGSHYLVHFSTSNYDTFMYYDVIDVHALDSAVPDHLIYGALQQSPPAVGGCTR